MQGNNQQPMPQMGPMEQGTPPSLPGQEGGFSPDQNPFQGIMEKIQQGGQPQGTPVASQPGETGDSSKPLMQAVQALYNYIASISDMKEIAMVRSLINLITQLIQRDQMRATQQPQMVMPEQTGQGAPAQPAQPAQ
jgi:hypothetical protein